MESLNRDQGPKIVALGGGHGLSNLLRGLKQYTSNLTAIVTVSDDGGGSGALRDDLGMLPPGDIRICMEALANTEPLMQQLLGYRFPEGRLAGQSCGNLLLAALNGVLGSFDGAVGELSQVLAITGQVLPVTVDNVVLEATFENGAQVRGESKIASFKKSQNCGIDRVALLPANPAALPATLEAIAGADIIVLGPGSLYTSLIPNLLVDGVAEAICHADAFKLYIANIMTQEGETENMTLSDHIRALQAHGGKDLMHLCLANSAELRSGLLERYSQEGAVPLTVDVQEAQALGVEVVRRSIAELHSSFARHSYHELARAVMELYGQRCCG